MPSRGAWSEREAKERLLALIEEEVGLDDVLDWLWEDHGIRVRGKNWESVRRVLMGKRGITARDLAVFLVEAGLRADKVEEKYLG